MTVMLYCYLYKFTVICVLYNLTAITICIIYSLTIIIITLLLLLYIFRDQKAKKVPNNLTLQGKNSSRR